MNNENGRISIEVKDRSDKVLIGIHDNGRALKRKPAYIFKRFYRADASRNTSKEGAAWTCHCQPDNFGAWRSNLAESEYGKGTGIYFELEKIGEDNEKKNLIIEDEVSIAELQRDYLEINGFEVHIEKTGDAGLLKALKEEIDLIILDLMLPNIDGFEICRKVREAKNIPVLMVSARKEDIDKIRGLGLGADDYITKPFSPSEL
jgi:CheY-like chemotaxis protein